MTITWENHIKLIIGIILMASLLGLVYAGILLLLKKQLNIKIGKQKKIIIPFFPTLIIAFWIMLLFGDSIISYFFSQFISQFFVSGFIKQCKHIFFIIFNSWLVKRIDSENITTNTTSFFKKIN